MAGFMLGLGLTFLLAGSPTIAAQVTSPPRRAAQDHLKAASRVDANLHLASTAALASSREPLERVEAAATVTHSANNGRPDASGKANRVESAISREVPVVETPELMSTAFDEPASAEIPSPTATQTPVRTSSRRTREPLPVAAGVLPQPDGLLPDTTPASGYSGMSLQEALRTAAKQLNN
jgi:hypothetical protein